VSRSASPPVRIVADLQERRSGIPTFLEELGAEVEVALLQAGDYAVSEDTIVERKQVRDLHSAVAKGHLWAQLAKLRGACAFPYLLVEGSNLDRGGLSPNPIRGVCLAVIDQGVALLQSSHQRDSARWLHRLAVRCQRIEAAPDRPVYAQRPKREAAQKPPKPCSQPFLESLHRRHELCSSISAVSRAFSQRVQPSGSKFPESAETEPEPWKKHLTSPVPPIERSAELELRERRRVDVLALDPDVLGANQPLALVEGGDGVLGGS
jgi:ERCC4-type nuclease